MYGTWSVVEIGGKSADVFDLPGGQSPRFGILYLHGHGLETLANKPTFARLFTEMRLACVCPHGQRSWWAARICPEFDPELTPERHLLEQVMPFFAARWGLAPRSIAPVGVSMGGQGALRLAFKRPDLFPVVAGIASAIDYHNWFGQGYPLDEMYDSKEQCRQDTATLHIHPSHFPPHIFFCIDPDDEVWYRGNDRLHEKLTALGVTHRIDMQTRHGGHSWDYFTHMADPVLRFCVDGLNEESRRLL